VSVRFIHTADWQLGKPFANVPGDPGALLREERFAAVRRIAGLASERRCDAVLVAGDVFDSNFVSDGVIERLLSALDGFRGPWVLLPGNHDCRLSECVWTRLARRAAGERLIMLEEPRPVPLAEGQLVVLPAPLLGRRTLEDLTAWMDACATPAGAVRVGLAHGSVTGRLPEAADAPNPIATDRAASARLDYLALGDWHGTLEIDERTWYAGTPEPDRFMRNEPGHALLVEIGAPGVRPVVERITVGRYRWVERRIALGALEPGTLVDHLRGRLRDLEPAQEVVLNLELYGDLSLADRAALDLFIPQLAARFCHLRLDETGLGLLPGPGEIAALDDGGVLGRAAQRLQGVLAESSGEARADAVLALRLLWSAARREGA
jgi:Calcineurin-like phosphoesterase